MKKVLIDLNVILDFLNKRGDHLSAAKIMKSCSDKTINGFVCAHEITTLAYFLEKEKIKNFRNVLSTLLKIFNIIELNKKILTRALTSPINDFEDAVIEVSAIESQLELIISGNLKDFKNSRVRTISVGQFIKNI